MRTDRARQHGMALMLVIAVVAMASLISMAMLSSASLQAQAASNHERSAVADYLAESAIQSAAYYLQRDLNGLPAGWGTEPGYAIHATNATISGVEGSFDVTAAQVYTDVYDLHATGRSSGSTPLTRSMRTRIRVVRATPTYAGGFGGASVINLGNYFSGAPVSLVGILSGAGLLNLLGGSRAATANDFVVPTPGSGQINYYGADIANGTYTTPAGEVGMPQTLASGTIASPATLNALPTNPGKVFYYNGHVFISGAGNYNGTVISRGKIEINAPLGSTITWNRQPGFPALMSDGSILVNSRTLNMTVNGVVFAGGGTAFAPLLAVTGSALKINGSLLVPAGRNLGAGGLGSMTVNYSPLFNDILNMTNVTQPPVALKYLEWDQ